MKLLPDGELICLSRVLHHVFNDQDFIPPEVNSVHNDSRYGRHSNILAHWAGDAGDIDTRNDLRPGKVRQIFVYKFRTDKGENYSISFARIQWYRSHARKKLYGNGLDLWHRDSYEQFGSCSYIPIACVNSKFAPAYGSIRVEVDTSTSHPTFQSVIFVCPLRSRHFV